MTPRRTLLALPAAAAAFPASGQERWPTRTITLIEGFPPGGVTDLVSRTLAERMARELGQNIVVDNRPGAATSVALTALARARPDGYTFGSGTTTLAINQTLQPTLTPRDPLNELAPVGMMFRTPFILHVHPSLPVRSVAELIALARAQPGRLSFGSPGTGSVSHLCLELFRARAGIDIVHVPYRGGIPALMDLRQNRVQAVFQGVQEALPAIREGATRALAVSTLGPIPQAPELPPIANDLPGFEVVFWMGLFAPAGTPQPILARAGEALAAATSDAGLRARMQEQGVELVTGDAQLLRDRLAADTVRWGEVIRAANIRVE
ncbi:MAG: tripartite tricarboxylate transporter substrate-binding protein [Roseococcus sp.]|nr:tripartite tricarboxylate transporter substrate-binding protein [Roseococcus sp.]